MKKICIVEDDDEYRDFLRRDIEDVPGYECVGTFDVAEAALRRIPLERPDIVLMDLGLDKSLINGIECMLRLKLVCPDLKFVVITVFDTDDKVFEALRIGAGAYILKKDIPDRLIQILDEFIAGGAPMSMEIARKVISSFHKSKQDLELIQQLTEREIEILELLSKGLLCKEIAAHLTHKYKNNQENIKEGTVKQHINHIYHKLQVNNRVEAIRRYLSH